MANETTGRPLNRYQAIIARVFADHHAAGVTEFEFTRDEFVAIAKALGIALQKKSAT